MTDPDIVQVDFEPLPSKAQKRAAAGVPAAKTRKPRLKDRIPVLPSLGVDPVDLRKPDQRAIACVNLRLAGAPFHEIAKQLEYVDAAQAKAAYISALNRTNPPEDWETLRQVETLRAEALLRRSLAMAGADFLIVHEVQENEDGEEVTVEIRVPNEDRLRWHEQAGKDLALHAMITGAKAPTRVEVSADTQELNQMVQVLIANSGAKAAIEADIWDAEEVPDGPEDEDE